MEQHPIPRNISSFQFRLIGDMTLRQFGYLAAGIAIAYIFFRASPLPIIITIPTCLTIAFLGIAFAFIPIQERPLDRWLAAFIKSIFSPTQYLWQKDSTVPEVLAKPIVSHFRKLSPVHIEANKDASNKLHAYLKTLPPPPHRMLNEQERHAIENTLRLFASSPQPTTVTVPNLTTQTADIAERPTTSTPPQPQPSPIIPTQALSTSNVVNQNLTQQLVDINSQKEALAKELASLKSELNKMRQPNIVAPTPAEEQKQQPTIKSVSAAQTADVIGMPQFPQSPNLVIGVVKDGQKRVLPNIILTIKDSKGIPLRALKTNKLGVFASATPLPKGRYYLEVEDPMKRFVFDIAQIDLTDKVFLPIEITAKGEKELMREKLTKEIFGDDNI